MLDVWLLLVMPVLVNLRQEDFLELKSAHDVYSEALSQK